MLAVPPSPRLLALECVTRDGDQGMRENLDMDGNRIVKLKDPSHNSDAVNKRYLDSALDSVKPYVTIWAKRSGSFTGPYQFSFGGGASTGRDQHYCGYVMMTNGRVMRMGLAATNKHGMAAGELTVTLVVNGEPNSQFHITKGCQQFSVFTMLDSPLEINPGDRINFMSSREDQEESNATAVTVSALIQLDL